MFDVGQIEVLRGPQGTLRGRASPSGSITITTRRPDLSEIGGYAYGTVTSNEGINVQGAVNLPIIKDVLALRVAGVFDDNQNNRVHSISNPNLEPSTKTRGVRVSLRAVPIDGLELNAQYTHLIERDVTWDQVESANLATGTALPAGSILINPADRRATESVPNFNRSALDLFNWQAQYSFLGQRLNYVGSYTRPQLLPDQPFDPGDFFGGPF